MSIPRPAVLAIALAIAAPATAQVGEDRFGAAAALTIARPVAGDLFAIGGTVDVDGAVGGDAIAVGGKLRLGADVGQSIYAAGGQLTIHGKVGRSARVAGGQVEFAPGSEIGGNLSVAGGRVHLLGAVRGQVQVAGGRLLIDGPVGGDVLVSAGEVSLGPQARIAGKLRYRGSQPPQRDPAAQVDAGTEALPARPGDPAPSERESRTRRGGGPALVWTLGLAALAAALLGLLPGFTGHVATTLRERPGRSLMSGFVAFVCLPVVVLLLLVSLVGIPLALATAAGYLALLPIAYAVAAIGIGDLILRRWNARLADRTGWRIGSCAVALLLLGLAARIPWLGGWIGFLVLLAGLGSLLLQYRSTIGDRLPHRPIPGGPAIA